MITFPLWPCPMCYMFGQVRLNTCKWVAIPIRCARLQIPVSQLSTLSRMLFNVLHLWRADVNVLLHFLSLSVSSSSPNIKVYANYLRSESNYATLNNGWPTISNRMLLWTSTFYKIVDRKYQHFQDNFFFALFSQLKSSGF